VNRKSLILLQLNCAIDQRHEPTQLRCPEVTLSPYSSQGYKSGLLQQPVLQQTIIAGPIEDNVIKQADANDLTRRLELPRYIQIV
jgi:hypothetical protein